MFDRSSRERVPRHFKAVCGSLLGAALTFAAAAPVAAQPWLEVGDRGLRSDVELLAAYGLIDGIVTSWPIPAGQLSHLSNAITLGKQPAFVRAAAKRVLKRIGADASPAGLQPTASMRIASGIDTVRDFGTLARDQVDARGGLTFDTDDIGVVIRAGEQTRFNGHGGRFSLDDSYASARLGPVRVYGGEVEQWYGPGWTSSLLLSNNARPFPKIGLMRDDTRALASPWLSWIGPWQANFFVGLLNGPRVDTHTAFGSLRISFSPLPGLEIALTRDTEFCGRNHPCKPASAAFHFSNSEHSRNKTNEEAGVDLKYTATLGRIAVSPYVQFMNEDTGPFKHSDTSYLGGATLAGPWRGDGGQWRFTAEAADSVATLDLLNFGTKATGTAYNNSGYVDGFRYRGRTLGFSLDSDSRLYSLAGLIVDRAGWSYRLVYYRAEINTAALAARTAAGSVAHNSVSAQPVRINQVEAGIAVPWRGFSFDLSVRGQDAQLFPNGGGRFVAEGGIAYRF